MLSATFAAAAAILAAAAPAHADHVAVLVADRLTPAAIPGEKAVGLLVPGRGPTVSRGEALDLLDWDELPSPACARRRPCPIEIFVSLPPREEQHNVRRYSIVIVGGGYRGLLVSEATRIDGLVFIGDVPRTVRALEDDRDPVIDSRREDDAERTLAQLDRRLRDVHGARDWASLVVVAGALGFALVALAARSGIAGRAAVLVAPAALGAALLLSALDEPSPLLLTVIAVPAAVAAALLDRLTLGVVLVGFLAAFLFVLVAWPEVNSLAMIGPHPDGGGRFYGVTNQVGTLLLVPMLLAAALLGRRALLPVALLAIVTIGWSRAGADGGGAIVVACGFVVLAWRLLGMRVTARRVALAAAAAAALLLALVGIDTATGGSSHVTRALEEGPWSLLGDFGHRLAVSWSGATSSWIRVGIVAAGVGALAWLAARWPRSAVLDALLIALAVSLVVNDTPTDVAGFGAISAVSLWSWHRVSTQSK
jgi:hypothetical protein